MFITVKDAAQKWAISEQLVRRYLRQNRIPGAVMDGQSWLIPMDAKKPANASRESIPLPPLAAKLVKQRNKRVRNGIYGYNTELCFELLFLLRLSVIRFVPMNASKNPAHLIEK